jgi:peptidoglycan/xylan/chitin deacetylase (PgdA/CDA1 family)
MYRYTAPSAIQCMDPLLIWKIREKEKAIFLTFDDGPHPELTPWVLDVLKERNALATFFCVGDNVRKYPGVYAEILRAGHRTGNHTFNHLNGWAVKNEEYYANIALCAGLVQSDLFRPPYGKISPLQAFYLKRKKYRVIMWSVISRDFEELLDCEESLAAMKRNTRKGSVILFHDSAKAGKNLREILPRYLDHFLSLGYKFKTI